MVASLQTKLLVAVSVLAVSAVIAVGLAARQSARYEFRKFQELIKKRPQSGPAPPAPVVVDALSAGCCDDAVVRAAAERLRSDELLFVVPEGADAPIAAAGAPLQRLQGLTVEAKNGSLTIDARREIAGAAEGITLAFHGPDAPRVTLKDGRRARIHVLRMPEPGRDQPAAVFLGSIDRRLLVATTAVGLLALATTRWLTRRIVGPIREVRDAAQDLARGNLGRRVAAHGSDEVAELARAFNAMAADLEHQQTLRRNLVHDVAHELRSPLTALRCRLETIIDGYSADPRQAVSGANEEVRHLSRLVDDLQELALAEAGELRLSIADVDVAAVVASAARAAGLEGDPRLRLAVPAHLSVRADAVRIRQAVLNLLTNADRHTDADGTITVTASQDRANATIEVRNTGDVLDDEQMNRVFDRFYRADPSRQRATGGIGLGLAIVKNLVEAQGGKVWARRESDGMAFGFALPAANVSTR